MSQTLVSRENKGNCWHDEPLANPTSFVTVRQRSCARVMFSVVSVCSRASGSYVTITHDPLDFTEQVASRPCPHLSSPSNMGPEDVPAPSSPTGGIWWTALETYWRPHLWIAPMPPLGKSLISLCSELWSLMLIIWDSILLNGNS